jgi:glycosyltransferase involved in cell wall biosynthesis
MPKILVISDDGVPSGYGRVAMEVNTRLMKRGYSIMAASLMFDGLLPPTNGGEPLPYWVASLAGRNWVEECLKIIGAYQPDLVLVIQDAPYAEAIRNAPVDWSRYGFMVITPVDGVPVFPRWVDVLKGADAAMTISEFGVSAYRKAGVEAALCRPGVDVNKFFALTLAQRIDIRARLGLTLEHFIVGTAAMNQGRKAISQMLRAFFEFAADKPHARYLLDMEPVSPAGWDIPALCQQFGWDASKLLFRADAARMGVVELRDRFNIMDAHMVISHREGYGLPLVEAQACGVVNIALDYTSGTEICGDGRGVLINTIEYDEIGTWGGAVDKYPDMKHLVNRLQWLYDNPHERLAIAERGMQWSRSHTWDETADAVQKSIEKALAKRAAIPPAHMPPQTGVQSPVVEPLPQSVDGTQAVALVEAR